MSEEIVYTSRIRLERIEGPLRRAYLPGETEPVVFGHHAAFPHYYRHDGKVFEEHATTIDYVAAATAG